MEDTNEMKSLSLAEYDRLCREACEGFVPSGSRDADEETLLYRICQKVYAYLDQEFAFIPVAGASDLYTYKWNLQQLVHNSQSESFDTLETPGKHINAALSKAYG